MDMEWEELKEFMPQGYDLNVIDKVGKAILSSMLLLVEDVYCLDDLKEGNLLEQLKSEIAKEVCQEIRDRMLATVANLAISMIEGDMTE